MRQSKTYLSAAAAITLLAGVSLAAAQRAQESPRGEAPNRAPSAQQNAPAEKMAPDAKSKSETTGQRDMNGDRAPKSGLDRSDSQRSPMRGTTGQSKDDQRRAKDDAQRPTTGQRDRQGQQQPGTTQQRQAPTTGQAARPGGASVNLTTEQRTKIRETVLVRAPKVERVNFAVRVGTVVPRNSVRLVAVPQTLVEIQPSWRGYLYFVVEDQIIIVEPRSLRIVAVLEV